MMVDLCNGGGICVLGSEVRVIEVEGRIGRGMWVRIGGGIGMGNGVGKSWGDVVVLKW